MRFLFITPGAEPKTFMGPHWLPLGFASIGALLKQHGHAVHVFDRYASMARFGLDTAKVDEAMLKEAKTFEPDVVGLATVSPMIYDTVYCAKILRGVFSGLMLAGGHHATALPRITLEKIPELDGVGLGESEESLLALAEGTKPVDISGFLWRQGTENGADKENRRTDQPSLGRLDDLDSLPFPDYSLFDTSFYTRRTSHVIRGFHISTLSMLGSRGCKYRCSFCTESMIYGSGVRFHSAEYITQMLARTLGQYPRVEGIYFHDNDFLIEPARVEQLCRRLIETGLHRRFLWAVQARSDRMDAALLRLMRRAGCIQIEIGVEAARQDDLDTLRKGTKATINESAIRLCHDAGITVHANFLTQTKGESLTDLEEKLDWLKRNRPDAFSLHPLSRYPGSALYHETGERFFERSDWTRANVLGFYAADIFSKITPGDRQRWQQTRLRPFSRKLHWLARFRLNPARRWPQIVWKAISLRMKRRIAQLKR
ncbi:MAG TPA: radical SAM protein [Smithella sp.]|nr:radical SAM protein [Smithella sp.]